MFMQNFFDFGLYKPDIFKAIRFIQSITLLECAALSLDTYGGERPPLPPRWTRFKSHAGATGYHGVCYVRDIDKDIPTCIVFAHRGTGQIADIVADLTLAINWIPDQAYSISNFLTKVKKKFIKKYGSLEEATQRLNNVPIISTGHSLGGALANLMITMTCVPSFTFENPGAKNIMIDYASSNGISKKDISTWMLQFGAFQQFTKPESILSILVMNNSLTIYTDIQYRIIISIKMGFLQVVVSP